MTLLTTRFRTLFVLLLTATLVACSLAAGSAHAEDNSGDGISHEESCDLLLDAYVRSTQYAIYYRSKGDQSEYEFWADQAQDTYLQAELDEQCEWATAMRLPRGGANGIVVSGGNSTGSASQANPTLRPPAYATVSAPSYHRWLASNNHQALCANVKRFASRHQIPWNSGPVGITAHFTHCGWGTLPNQTSSSAVSPTQTVRAS